MISGFKQSTGQVTTFGSNTPYLLLYQLFKKSL